ncbi:hypothetical protein [Nonomuraea rubra]|uniref:hypothetical protein n=1 Tax=Nonomuraea rubra TaxID=46180 RepID=UPI0031F1BBF8
MSAWRKLVALAVDHQHVARATAGAQRRRDSALSFEPGDGADAGVLDAWPPALATRSSS